jgi:hypothetical protein
MKSLARTVVLSILLVGLGILACVRAVVWLQRESYLTALIIFLTAIWAFGFAAYFSYSTFAEVSPRAEYSPSGTLLRADASADISFITATSAIFIAAVLYLLFAPFGMVDYVPTGVMRTAVPAGCAFLIAFGGPTLYRMIKHGGGGHLRLDQSGFEVWNGQWGTFRRGTWDEIERIQDHPPRGRTPFNEVIVFLLASSRSVMLMADAISGDSDALRQWVDFYWQYPEFRDELVDERGLRRLREQRFTP